MGSIKEELKKLVLLKRQIEDAIQKRYSTTDWSIRKITVASRKNDPSITLKTELGHIGVHPDEYVIVILGKDELGNYILVRPIKDMIPQD